MKVDDETLRELMAVTGGTEEQVRAAIDVHESAPLTKSKLTPAFRDGERDEVAAVVTKYIRDSAGLANPAKAPEPVEEPAGVFRDGHRFNDHLNRSMHAALTKAARRQAEAEELAKDTAPTRTLLADAIAQRMGRKTN